MVEWGDDEGLLVVHADHPPPRQLDPGWTELGTPNAEGGTMGILDAAALTDPAFGLDEVLRARANEQSFGDRGVATSTHGDGAHHVLVDRAPHATIVFIAF